MKNEPPPARADGTITHRSAAPAGPAPAAAQPPLEATLASPIPHEPSQSLVTRAAIGQVVRAAVVGSYGVTGLADDRFRQRLLVRLGLRPPAIAVRLGTGIQVELRILVAAGMPVAEVARQVDSAVRYAVRQAIEREIDALTIHVGGLRFQVAPLPESPSAPVPADPAALATEPGQADPGTTGSDAA
jgi:uncharacterized alkaline shock family protein YloU